MFNHFPLRGSFAMAITVALALAPQTAQAFNVVYDGTTYDLEVYTGSYDNNPASFATSVNSGRIPWWGNPDLADHLANALASGLSALPYPNFGPLFATAFDATNPGQEVTASYFDLTSLGSTNVVTSSEFSRDSQQSYVVAASSVPAPLPFAATVVCVSAVRRLRRLSTRLAQQRFKL